MITIFKKNKKGFTLIEMLIYIALMTVITFTVVQSLVVVFKSNKASFAEINIRNSGYSAMEGMIREIYASDSIDTASSGILKIKQGTSTIKFATSSSGVLNFYNVDGNNFVGPLTSTGVLVKSLIFTPISTGRSFAIRIQMKLENTIDGQTRTENFYSTAILRGSY